MLPRVRTALTAKVLNCQNCKKRVHVNTQSPKITEDVADGVHVDKGDFDDLVAKVPQTQIVEKTVEIPQMQTVEKIAGKETFESSTICWVCCRLVEKQPENDVSGRVSESRKCFQLGTQFRDTSSRIQHS